MRKQGRHRMVILAGSLSVLLAASGVSVETALADEAGKDWGEYKIDNDGYGYLTANFPDKFTSEYIIIENSVSTSQKVDALMLTMNDREKCELLEADGYWAGIARLGIPEVIFYSSKEDSDLPAPGLNIAMCSYDVEEVNLYGTAAAAAVIAAGANAIAIPEEEGTAANGYWKKSAVDSIKNTVAQSGVISGLSKQFCSRKVEEMTDQEIDDAVYDILFEIGKAGYLGMVQVSRDGLAAEDPDAPDKISLELSGTEDFEMEGEVVKNGAVLLKNSNNTLPLASVPDLSGISNTDMTAVSTTETCIFYIAAGDTLSEEQKQFLSENIEKEKEEQKEIVLLLSAQQGINLDSYLDSCDAVLFLGTGEKEATVLAGLLSGETAPEGRLVDAWPTKCEEWEEGYGLSYSEFSYELISTELASENDEDFGLDVTVKVTNTGTAAGKDTILLYLDGEEGSSFAASKKTDQIEAGANAEIQIHISQEGLSTVSDGETSVLEGKRTLYVAHDSLDTNLSSEVEISAAKAGASVEIEVPEKVTAGEVFDVKVSTPTDVISLQMEDSDGTVYQPVDVLKENLGDSILFTYSIQIDRIGTATICVYTKTAEGLSAEASVETEIVVE